MTNKKMTGGEPKMQGNPPRSLHHSAVRRKATAGVARGAVAGRPKTTCEKLAQQFRDDKRKLTKKQEIAMDRVLSDACASPNRLGMPGGYGGMYGDDY